MQSPVPGEEQPQEPVHAAGEGQQLDGKQLGREAPRILLDKRLNTSQQCVPVAKADNSIMGFTKKSIASRLKEVILSFHLALERHPQSSELASGLPREFRDILEQIW